MVVLVGAENLVAVFLGFELLSIPLYVLCATHMRREHSLESGLKYLIIGSVGSATLLYGLAVVAPFHQWTPGVDEGAPTPITAFMAVATKAAALGVLLRLFDVALIGLTE